MTGGPAEKTNEVWTVWGDNAEPVLVDTEEECKKYVTSRPDEIDLYVTDPEGNDWIYDENEQWKLEYSILGS